MTPPPPRTLGPLTVTDFVRYQGASGDLNPIHHDAGVAAAAGFDAPLGVGMLPAGAMCAWATDWLGPANLRSFRVKWRRPVFPGDVLTIDGALVDAPEGRVGLHITCARGEERVAEAWAGFADASGPPERSEPAAATG